MKASLFFPQKQIIMKLFKPDFTAVRYEKGAQEMRTELSRRGFLKAAAVTTGAAALGLSGLTVHSASAEDEKQANRVCQILGIEKPVVQAIMSHLTSPELAAAVSNAGGLGLVGVSGIDDFRENIRKVKSLTDKSFGVEFNAGDAIIAMLQEEGVKIVFIVGLGGRDGGLLNNGANNVDVNGIKKAKEAGFTVIFRDVNCTIESALKAQEAGADIVVLSGYGNGGHMGESRVTINSLMAEAKGQFRVPLMCSGCIATRVHADAAAAMGAEGVYVGTRFNASVESPCAQATKEAIVKARAEDLVEWRGILGFVHGTDTPFSRSVVAASDAGATRAELTGMYNRIWSDMRNGTIDESCVCVSDCVNSITSIKTCQEIVDELGAAFV